MKSEFTQFYPALFARAHDKEKKRALFTEYVWNMSWCDPCAADPLSSEDPGDGGRVELPGALRAAPRITRKMGQEAPAAKDSDGGSWYQKLWK